MRPPRVSSAPGLAPAPAPGRGRGRGLAVTLALAVLGTTACEEHEFHPPDRAEQVAAADSAYSPAIFDTLSWSDAGERLDAGNLVYADECRRCHGPMGQGGTEYAEGRGLQVPSLVRPDWPEGADPETLRRLIFVGHPAGMPSWGMARLSPRQIDAAAHYIAEGLRPEVLGDEH